MSKTSKTTVFFGSGPVAAQSLQLLLNWINIELVVTKSNPAHHKESAPVETLASQNNIKIVYANNRTELDQLIEGQQIPKLDFAILIDFGVIVSQKVIDYFPLGIINSHFSILPEWRGADPISYALLSGQSSTGVSLMLLDKGMDTGDLIAQESLAINHDETNQSLTNKLISLSNDMLQKNIDNFLEQKIKPYKQPHKLATYSTKLSKPDGIIASNKIASQIEREVRAYESWPNSRILYKDLWLTLTKVVVNESPSLPAGQLQVIDKKLYFGTPKNAVQILELKPAGKKNMSASAFINGYTHIFKKTNQT